MVRTKCKKTSKTPRRPFEKERLDNELELIGKYGLKNKREVWRVKYTLAKIRKRARELLKLDQKDPRRLFEGNALIRHLARYSILSSKGDQPMLLDDILSLKIEDFLNRRLQTIAKDRNLAKTVHEARILIKQRHICLRDKLVTIPSFMITIDSEKHLCMSKKSPFNGGKKGRHARQTLNKKKTKEENVESENAEMSD